MPSINNRHYILADANDPAAYDEHGILRDGYRIRVPLTMMDGAPRRFAAAAPAPEPMVIRTGLPLRGPGSLRSEFFADGSRKDEFDPECEELDDARRRRRRTVERDPRGRQVAEFVEEDHTVLADHRPGFRYGVTAADRQRVADAYNDMVADLQTQWMSPEQRAQHVADARLTTDACPDGVDPRAWAYDQMVRDLTDAWRPRDASVAKEGAQAPKILPVGAMPKHIGTIKAGDACTVDGADGVYVDGGDGNLYCKTRPMPTTRAATNSHIDAMPPRYMTAADAQPIRDRAYQEYVDHVSNAWKQP